MRILFVALPSNIHTLRWINHILDQGWDIHLAPSLHDQLHPDLVGKVTFYNPITTPVVDKAIPPTPPTPPMPPPLPRWKAAAIWLLRRWPHPRGSGHARRLLKRLAPIPQPAPEPAPQTAPPPVLTQRERLVQNVADAIRTSRPDIVHVQIIQPSGHIMLDARKLLGEDSPKWIMSNWGSDVHFYGQLDANREIIREVLGACDYLSCECERDVTLSRQFGFKGKVLPVMSAAGGFDLGRWQALRQSGLTSGRRVILLKGYQHIVGRALAGLRALELCADVLQEYRILVHVASPGVSMAAEVVSKRTGIPIDVIQHAWHTDYETVMRRYGVARIHLALSISDGIRQSLLEAMMMGAFPIQSCTACADEWFVDGEGGLLVPPEDPHIIAEAIRRAVLDDALVDRAAEINAETVRQRLDYDIVKQNIVAMYQSVYEDQLERQ